MKSMLKGVYFIPLFLAIILIFSLAKNHHKAARASSVVEEANFEASGYRSDREKYSVEIHRGLVDLDAMNSFMDSKDFWNVKKMIDGMSSDQFPEVWEMFMKHRSGDNPPYFDQLLRSLVLRGVWDGNLTTVLDSIQKDVGLGSQRSSLIDTAFHNARVPISTLIEAAQKFEIQEEKESALEGISQNISNLMPWEELEKVKVDGLSDSVIEAIIIGIAEKPAYSKMFDIGDTKTEIDKVLRLSEVLSSEVDGRNLKQEILAKLVMTGMKDLWPILREKGFFSDGRDPSLDSALAEKYYRSSPEKSLELVTELKGFSARNTSIIVDRAINRDLRMASEWFHVNSSDLSDEAQSGVAASFAKSGAVLGEFDTAWDWLGKIDDPELKKETEAKVWSAEQKEVTSRVEEAPATFLSEFVAGDSGHADYWIKTAYSEWLEESPSEAATWYQEHKDVLAPEQNQHVARVYADQAIKNGDLEAAKQWLGQVVEEKFRGPLDKQIQAASANQ